MFLQQQDPKQQTAQEFMNVEAIEKRILWTQDKMLFAFIRVRDSDHSLLTQDAHTTLTDKLSRELSDQKEPFQIISVPRTVDVAGMLQNLEELRSSTSSDARLRLIDGEAAALEELTEAGTKEPLLFLKIWCPAAPNADRNLLERAETLAKRFSENGISARILDDSGILHLCRIYAELGVWQPETVDTDIPILPDVKRRFSRKPSPEEQERAELMEQITPAGGLLFERTGLMVGGSYCACYGATRYPAGIDFGWATKLMGSTDCITCITYYPGNASEIGDALSRSIKVSNREASSQNDIRTKKRYERKARDADRLIDEQDGEGMALGYISMVVMVYAGSKAELAETAKNVVARYGHRQIKLRLMSMEQKDAYRHISPYYPAQPVVGEMLRRIVPLRTLMGGYPCTINTLRDDHGLYFARTLDQSMISLDVRVRAADRTNGNGIVTGIPGVGKSTMLKHLLESFYMQGIKILVIDPEREFRTICKNLGGSWWDAGGGNAMINLLQIQAPIPDDEEDPTLRSEPNPLSEHLQHVKTILRYKIPSMTDMHLELMERALRELYASYGIGLDWVFDPARPPEDYPVMADLYWHIKRQEDKDPLYRELALLLESMAVGADSVIWNGHTNVDLSADLVVIDTNRLYNSSPQNRSAQYYNIMRLAFTKASADKTTPYAIFADEAQILFDPELPAASLAMKNIASRIRKYEGYLWLAFHSLHELLDDRIRLNGQPVLDAAGYKILFGTDGRNLSDTVSLFGLTAAEEKCLLARQRGKALVLIGNQHLMVDFVLPSYKLELMGKGGGR